MCRSNKRCTSSRFVGVGWHKPSGKWQATIWYDGKLHHLGLFTDEIEAARIRDKREKEVRGRCARLNTAEIRRAERQRQRLVQRARRKERPLFSW